MKYRVGILLCGCGSADGSDPQEAILLQLAVEKAGHQTVMLALDEPQLHVVDHSTHQETSGEVRRQFVESARLVRGKLHQATEIAPGMLQALIVCGGQGVPKNLMTSFGPDAEGGDNPVHPPLREFLMQVHERKGILGFISLGEFLGSALLGPWPEERGCFDLSQGEPLVDEEKGRVLTAGNLNSPSLPDLQTEMESFLGAILRLVELKTCNT